MIPLADALGWLRGEARRRAAETVPLELAVGRVLSVDLALSVRPAHPTAAMDGVAVRGVETEGASDYAPLPVAGMRVHAGSRLPPGAGATTAAIARGGNVRPAGHDVPGDVWLAAGTILTPLHLAILDTDPRVAPRPRVAAPPWPAVRALLVQAGAIIVEGDADLVLMQVPAFTQMVAAGIAIRPGETTAIGLVDAIPAICLPPHPADAATVFALLAAPVLRHLARLPEPEPREGRLSRKISSSLGQVDAVRVRLDGGTAVPLGPAEGIGLLAAAGANGLVLVPEGSEGYPAGTMVPIFPV
jgi:molybdopterin biosynthesis enzyme